MNKFVIEIPNPGITTYRLITNLLLIINILVFGILLFGNPGRDIYSILSLMGLVLNVAAIFLQAFKINPFNKFNKAVTVIFILNALLWLMYGKFLLALLMVLFAIAGLYANQKLQIDFSSSGILYPSFPPKLIPWSEVEQAICKDGMLSIDLKNNKLLQFNIAPEITDHINELDFNTFCDVCVHQHAGENT